MKKLILTVIFGVLATISVSNAATITNKKELKTDDSKGHRYCKSVALSVAYTCAEISGEEPKVSDFKEAYKKCMKS